MTGNPNFSFFSNPNGQDGTLKLWPQFKPESPCYMKIDCTTTESRRIEELRPNRIYLLNHTVPRMIEENYEKSKY